MLLGDRLSSGAQTVLGWLLALPKWRAILCLEESTAEFSEEVQQWLRNIASGENSEGFEDGPEDSG